MLEILVLMAFSRKLRDILQSKGRSNAWMLLGVMGWIGGEIFGLFVGMALGFETGAYGTAILCAAIGAGIAYFVINGLAPAGGFEDEMADTMGVESHLQDPNNPFNPPRR